MLVKSAELSNGTAYKLQSTEMQSNGSHPARTLGAVSKLVGSGVLKTASSDTRKMKQDEVLSVTKGDQENGILCARLRNTK